jgi:hypothetical protein
VVTVATADPGEKNIPVCPAPGPLPKMDGKKYVASAKLYPLENTNSLVPAVPKLIVAPIAKTDKNPVRVIGVALL